MKSIAATTLAEVPCDLTQARQVGRRRLEPVKLNRGDGWYARLTVSPADRAKAVKTRLIRSLKTTSHAVALNPHRAACSAREKELTELLKDQTFRERIEGGREKNTREPWQKQRCLEYD